MIKLELPEIEDAKLLTLISKNAFDTDIDVGLSELGGPPYYDSEKWHISMIESENILLIKNEMEIIGGLIIFDHKNDKRIKYVGRIFIDPKYHKMGYGIEAMKQLEARYPSVRYWKLDTPKWNTRTKAFYEKLGYKEIKTDSFSRYYQKEINN